MEKGLGDNMQSGSAAREHVFPVRGSPLKSGREPGPNRDRPILMDFECISNGNEPLV